MTNPERNREYLSSYGRNRGRTLRPVQQKLVDELLPKLQIPSSRGAEGDAAIQYDQQAGATELIRSARNDGFNKVALEIGFGGGEHLVAQAAGTPDTLFIGVEPYINGVAKCLVEIDRRNLKNIRLNTQDARILVKALPDACLDSVFILFPDPWPKARHNKRRLVNQETLSMIARAHKKGGRLLIATDHIDYSHWILEQLMATPHYTWTAEKQADWLEPPADWTQTKYQRKTTEQGREPLFFECVRN